MVEFDRCLSSAGNNVYTQKLLRVIRFSLLSAGLVGMEPTTRTNCCMYTLLSTDDEQLASPKHVEV
jgi:hypothetical protein